MARQKNPILVSGPTYVWCPGFENLPAAHQHTVVRRASAALAAGRLVVEFGEGSRLLLAGVMIGQSLEEAAAPRRLMLGELGAPVLVAYGVVCEGRLPGIPVKIGLFDDATNRKWMISFGHIPMERWRREIGVREFFSVADGALIFTTQENRATVRKDFFEQRKAADQKWRS